MAQTATQQTQDNPNDILKMLLGMSQGNADSGANSSFDTPENQLTAETRQLNNQMAAAQMDKNTQQENQNRAQYGQAPEHQTGLLGQLLGGALHKYVSGKIDKAQAGEDLKLQQDYLKQMPKDLHPIDKASYLAQGPTKDLQTTGNNMLQQMLGNQDSASYLQPKTIQVGGDSPNTRQQQIWNTQTRQFENVGAPISSLNPYSEENQMMKRQAAEQSRQQFEQNTALKQEDQSIQRQGVTDKRIATNTGVENQYRDEFNTLTKPHQLMESAFNKVQAAFDPKVEPSPANDLAGIYATMRSYDPNSTVREGEFATAQNAGSVPTSIINAYNKALNGERLTPGQRADFLNSSRQQYKASAEQAQKYYDRYSTMAKRQGINAENVVTPISGYEPPPKPTSTAAPLGTKERPILSPAQARKMLEERGLLKPQGTTGQW